MSHPQQLWGWQTVAKKMKHKRPRVSTGLLVTQGKSSWSLGCSPSLSLLFVPMLSTVHGTSGGLVAKSCLIPAIPQTVACQALSMGFSRQEYWNGLPGDLPDPGIEPASPALQAYSLLLSHQGTKHQSIFEANFYCFPLPPASTSPCVLHQNRSHISLSRQVLFLNNVVLVLFVLGAL